MELELNGETTHGIAGDLQRVVNIFPSRSNQSQSKSMMIKSTLLEEMVMTHFSAHRVDTQTAIAILTKDLMQLLCTEAKNSRPLGG